MKEQVLLDYLKNKVSVELLAADLKGSQIKTGYDTTSVNIEDIKEEGEFNITKEHLIRLCNDALNGNLSFEDLNTIAFAVFASEFFCNDENDEIVDRVLFDWDNPEIGFSLTEDNMKKWKQLLETGVDGFDIRELKQKRKNAK
jgi:hypothetical protein